MLTSNTNQIISLEIPANEPLADAEKDMDQFVINFLQNDEAFQRNKKRNEERTKNIKNGKIKLFELLISCSDKEHKNCEHNMFVLFKHKKFKHKNMEILYNLKRTINGTVWCIAGNGWVESDGIEQLKKELLDMKEVADIDLDFNIDNLDYF